LGIVGGVSQDRWVRPLVLAGCALSLVCCRPPSEALPVAATADVGPSPSVTALPPSQAAPPRSFSYRGQPVHPVCVSELVMGETKASTDLAACAVDAGPATVEGATVTYEWPDDAVVMRQPFMQYEVLAFHDDAFFLSTIWNGGGSGMFTSVIAVTLGDGELALRSQIVGGDRCNGGIAEAHMKNGVLELAINVTPVDIVELARAGSALGLRAYQDLDASAAACFAKARYRYDATTQQRSLLTVDFAAEPVDNDPRWAGQFAHQACFNTLFNSRVGRKLLPQDLEAFVEEFRQSCLSG
jgi:hypothetical protein